MTIDRKKLRWNGWGWNESPDPLGERGPALWDWLQTAFGIEELPSTPAAELSSIQLPSIRLSATQSERLGQIVPTERVKTDDYERAFHARGQSYLDLLQLRAGNIDTAPDAVVYPNSSEEVAGVVRFCHEENVALIPFGGGSSVVGGVTAVSGDGQSALITLDMTLMDEVLEIDGQALTARVQAGIYGPKLEADLAKQGYTLGHYPQSFEFSTLGGWIAHRGAGQQSNKYGKAEKWFVAATLATPQGIWSSENFPASAAGPQLGSLIVGSEGTLGVITEAVVKIQPAPEKKDYRGYVFGTFEAGLKTVREVVQAGIPVAMLRLSDADETQFLSALRGGGSTSMGEMRLCVLLVGHEGTEAAVDAAVSQSQSIAANNQGMHLGEDPGQGWYKGRFSGPYLRDPLLDRGLAVETLETSTGWSNIEHLHAAVTDTLTGALKEHAAPGVGSQPDTVSSLVMAHLSHSYSDGASLYFTFVFPRDLSREIEQFRNVKAAACEALLAGGGTISHHHGVGLDHAGYLEREKGALGVQVLRSIKAQIDPGGILNPGKLIEPSQND